MRKVLLFIFISISLLANNLSQEERAEAKIGTEYFEKILQESNLSKNIKRTKLVKKVGSRISNIIDKDYDWKFALLQGEDVNAFCLPGGKVIIFEGLFKVLENDDQLATVISHEIAHALLRHGGMRARADAILSIPKQIGKDFFGDLVPKELHGTLDTVYDIGKNLTVIMPYGREQESEADRLGVQIMYKAKYNPREAIKLWENMKKVSPDSIPEFLSTHPNNDERIRVIQDEINKLN